MNPLKPLEEIVDINPRFNNNGGQNDLLVSFLPMSGLSERGFIVNYGERKLSQVEKGYNYFEEGDVLLAKITPCMENGKAAYVDKLSHSIGFGSTEFHVLRPKKGVDGKYLFYMVWNPYFRNIAEMNMTGTAGQKRVPRSFIEKFKIPFPQIEDQRRIADILDKADAIRRKRQEAMRLTEDLLQSVFLEMFGDVVKNKKNWPIYTFIEICETRLGKMLDAKQQTGNHLRPYLRNANVQWDRFDLSVVFKMDFDKKDREILRLKKGDILICEGGEVGRSAIWRDELPECYFQKALHRVRPNPDLATSEYIVNLMWFYSKYGGFKDQVSSVTIAHLTGVKLKEMKFPLPPLQLQQKFSKVVNQVRSIETKLNSTTKETNQLFDSLVQRAFRGEL
ncbi:MAG: restriction endonuclease [Candidatus Omnitrophota bacterium]|jgi:type I restriction enzyme S subunit|nr:MAG: restriction endonuclease [Candidatus Omnitrophota bacterium]